MSRGSVTVAHKAAVATITLASPGSKNRLDAALRSALADAFEAAESDGAVRVVVLTGEGPAFATGMEPPPVTGDGTPGVASAVAAMTKPTVAWVEGDCLDMGLELALACDIRVAGRGARFGVRHVAGGALPWDGGTQRLARAVGRAHALRLLLTGEVVSAEEALRIGLVQQVGGPDELTALAESIAAGAPVAAAYAKEATLAGLEVTIGQGLRLEADLSVLLQSTADRAEGLRKFAEGASPDYQGS